MRNKIILIPIVFLILAFSVSAIKIDNTVCYGDGSFRITFKANSEKYVDTTAMSISAEDKKLKGTWDNGLLKLTSSDEHKYATFKGGENQLTEKKTYPIKVLYTEKTEWSEEDSELTFNLECPGLIFTCQKMGIKIKDCITSMSGKFTANLDIYGLEQSEEGKLNPLEVIDFTLNTPMLYKDINGFTSKSGSLIEGATIKKIGYGKYLIEANFDRYTTNHVKDMLVKFNDNLGKPCNPVYYPEAIFSYKKECEYKETEEDRKKEKDILAEYKEVEPEEPIAEEQPEPVNQEEQSIEEQNEENLLKENKIEETKNTGYSIKETTSNVEETSSLSRKKAQLKVMIYSLFGIILIGAVLLSYLYKQGYFY